VFYYTFLYILWLSNQWFFKSVILLTNYLLHSCGFMHCITCNCHTYLISITRASWTIIQVCGERCVLVLSLGGYCGVYWCSIYVLDCILFVWAHWSKSLTTCNELYGNKVLNLESWLENCCKAGLWSYDVYDVIDIFKRLFKANKWL